MRGDGNKEINKMRGMKINSWGGGTWERRTKKKIRRLPWETHRTKNDKLCLHQCQCLMKERKRPKPVKPVKPVKPLTFGGAGTPSPPKELGLRTCDIRATPEQQQETTRTHGGRTHTYTHCKTHTNTHTSAHRHPCAAVLLQSTNPTTC